MGDDRFVNNVSRVLVLGPGFVEAGDLKQLGKREYNAYSTVDWTYRITHAMAQMDTSVTESDTSKRRSKPGIPAKFSAIRCLESKRQLTASGVWLPCHPCSSPHAEGIVLPGVVPKLKTRR